MVPGLAILEQSRWGHIDCRIARNGRIDSYGDTDVYNGCNCYKQNIDGQSATDGSSQFQVDIEDSVQGDQLRFYLEGWVVGHLLEVGFFPSSYLSIGVLSLVGYWGQVDQGGFSYCRLVLEE